LLHIAVVPAMRKLVKAAVDRTKAGVGTGSGAH